MAIEYQNDGRYERDLELNNNILQRDDINVEQTCQVKRAILRLYSEMGRKEEAQGYMKETEAYGDKPL